MGSKLICPFYVHYHMCQCDWTTTSPDVTAVFTPAKEAGWDLFQILSSYAVMFPGLSPEFWSEARGLE